LVPIVSILTLMTKRRDAKMEDFSVDYLLPVQIDQHSVGVVFRDDEPLLALVDHYDIVNKAILCNPTFDIETLSCFRNVFDRLRVICDDGSKSTVSRVSGRLGPTKSTKTCKSRKSTKPNRCVSNGHSEGMKQFPSLSVVDPVCSPPQSPMTPLSPMSPMSPTPTPTPRAMEPVYSYAIPAAVPVAVPVADPMAVPGNVYMAVPVSFQGVSVSPPSSPQSTGQYVQYDPTALMGWTSNVLQRAMDDHAHFAQIYSQNARFGQLR